MARGLTLLLPLFVSCAALAQSADPTRPAIDTGISAPDAATPATAGLQSIIQRRNGKPAALINGAMVELGGKVGEARLVRIGDDFVVLRGALGNEILRLTPDVEKKVVRKEKK
jgi:hypothetical protein